MALYSLNSREKQQQQINIVDYWIEWTLRWNLQTKTNNIYKQTNKQTNLSYCKAIKYKNESLTRRFHQFTTLQMRVLTFIGNIKIQENCVFSNNI